VDSIKAPILENIHEEKGNYEQEDIEELRAIGIEEEWYNRIPHKLLSQRFFESLGIEAADIPAISSTEIKEDDGAGVVFTKIDVDSIKAPILENIHEEKGNYEQEETVSRLYQFVWKGLKDHTPLTDEEIVFFPLHILIDDGHADLLKLGFKHYVQNAPGLCTGARDVVEKVLEMRIKMYDDIRRDIEQRQGYRCPLPYGPDGQDVDHDEL